MLSVCIPTYNYDVSILIDALLFQKKQFDFSIEILVYDDFSAPPIHIKNSEITLITSTGNYGSIYGRKQLAQKAKYENLLFLDADVLLGTKNFLKEYVRFLNTSYEIIYGGISYRTEKPLEGILRWKYGKSREAKKATQRMELSYQNLISMGFLIKKDIFYKVYDRIHDVGYGGDILISSIINSLGIQIKHIDNPVIHMGLESNDSFYKKTLIGIENTVTLYKTGKIAIESRPIISVFYNLHQIKIDRLTACFIRMIKFMLLRNMNSTNPSLLGFDLLKLEHFIDYFYKD
ncbi:glycosyltransferase family 2 protein [Nonlabens sp.]|uniref:glycosyltransferase family 2 protein n=1 Tax=Nonlabens sp. TaxID=1888209 RepID=UPI003F6A0A35